MSSAPSAASATPGSSGSTSRTSAILLNHNWGVGQRMVWCRSRPRDGAQILSNAAADAQGRVSYRLAVVNNELVTRSFQTTTNLSDVYQFLISFRYTFN